MYHYTKAARLYQDFPAAQRGKRRCPMSRIGKNIRALREAYGETQLDLAHHLGFDSPAAVSMIEGGV